MRFVIDLGIGTGALVRACLESASDARDLDLWLAHLGKTFGSRARGRRVYESWADEDVYVPLAEEIHLLTRDGRAVVGMPRP